VRENFGLDLQNKRFSVEAEDGLAIEPYDEDIRRLEDEIMGITPEKEKSSRNADASFVNSFVVSSEVNNGN